jgi:hypothetical protein
VQSHLVVILLDELLVVAPQMIEILVLIGAILARLKAARAFCINSTWHNVGDTEIMMSEQRAMEKEIC